MKENIDRYKQGYLIMDANEKRAQLKEQLKDINNWPKKHRELLHAKGDDEMKQILLDELVASVDEIPDELFDDSQGGRKAQSRNLPGVWIDDEFMKATLTLLPPRSSFDDSQLFDTIRALDKSRDGRINQSLLSKARNAINSSWKTNPCMFDPIAFAAVDGNAPVDTSDPVVDFLVGCLDWDFMSEPLDKEVLNQAIMNDEKPEGCTQFFDYSARFFWNVGHALAKLTDAGALKVEWNIGDIVSVCSSLRQSRIRRFS